LTLTIIHARCRREIMQGNKRLVAYSGSKSAAMNRQLRDDVHNTLVDNVETKGKK